MLFQVKVPTHPAKDHRLRDWAFLRPQSEVDVHHDQCDQSYACQAVQYIHHAPGQVAEEIWIAGKEEGAHARHHEHTGYNRRKTGGEDGSMVELVLQRIFGEFIRWWFGLSGSPQCSSPCISQVNAVRPDGPEVHKEGRMDDVKQNGSGQDGSRDPMISHPRELDANLRQEGGKQ